jgi:hypothetical protein
VAELLHREPITVQNWPIWRERLLTWIGDLVLGPVSGIVVLGLFPLHEV